MVTAFVLMFKYTADIFTFVKLGLLSIIPLSIFIYTQNFFSRKYGCSSKIELWKFFLEHKKRKKKRYMIPVGIILPILISIFSEGQIFFVASFSSIVEIKPAYRIGRKYTRLTDYESAKIYLSGPLVLIIFSIILKLVHSTFFSTLIFVNCMIAISYMIPLPGLNGCKIFFGSKNLYVFGLAFILASTFLLRYLSSFSTLIIALSSAIIALVVFYYYKVYKN